MSLAHQIIAAGEGRAPALHHYDAACRALAEAKSVDDVKDIRDKSEAIRAYAKQAKNKQLEVDAAEIRIRAERRLGEMIAAQRETVGLNEGGRPTKTGSQQNPVSFPTLAEAGIDKNLADRARKLAAIPEAEFSEIVSDWRERVERENERVSVNLLKSGERHVAEQAVDTRTEAERGADAIEAAWDRSCADGLTLFMARKNLSFIAEPADAAVAAGNDLREPTAAASGQIIREGDAPREPDCQAGEQSQGGGDASCPDAEIPETPANPSAPQARQATAAGEVNPPASPAPLCDDGRNGPIVEAEHVEDEESTRRGSVTNSSNDAIGEVKARSRLPNAAGVEPSLPEADAGGPVSASAAHSDPAERPSDAIFGERFSHPTSDASISSQPAGSVGVPHSIPHKSGEMKVQPAKFPDPYDPGPIPAFMDRRTKKEPAA